MEQIENNESKERILSASIKLFSEKGFDATRVNEIAETANVNKALIYYYFKSKEEILDYLVSSLFNSVTSMVMDFIHESVVHMVDDGLLDIEPDRLHFVSEEALQLFLKNMDTYYEKVLDYVIEHRHIIRILLVESLKDGKHHDDLFRLMDLTKDSENNPVYTTIRDADKDFIYTEGMVLHKFFFSLMPIINFAVYLDDYKKRSPLSEQELRDSFLRSLKIGIPTLISGKDILLLVRE